MLLWQQRSLLPPRPAAQAFFPIELLGPAELTTDPEAVRGLPLASWPPVATALGELLQAPTAVANATDCIRDFKAAAPLCLGAARAKYRPSSQTLLAWHAYLERLTTAASEDDGLLRQVLNRTWEPPPPLQGAYPDELTPPFKQKMKLVTEALWLFAETDGPRRALPKRS